MHMTKKQAPGRISDRLLYLYAGAVTPGLLTHVGVSVAAAAGALICGMRRKIRMWPGGRPRQGG